MAAEAEVEAEVEAVEVVVVARQAVVEAACFRYCPHLLRTTRAMQGKGTRAQAFSRMP